MAFVLFCCSIFKLWVNLSHHREIGIITRGDFWIRKPFKKSGNSKDSFFSAEAEYRSSWQNFLSVGSEIGTKLLLCQLESPLKDLNKTPLFNVHHAANPLKACFILFFMAKGEPCVLFLSLLSTSGKLSLFLCSLLLGLSIMHNKTVCLKGCWFVQ